MSANGAVLRTYGFSVDSDDEVEIDTPEASFFVAEDGRTEVYLWTGTWPFPVEHPQGVLPSIEEAARYTTWLLKREALYIERDEAKWHDQEGIDHG